MADNVNICCERVYQHYKTKQNLQAKSFFVANLHPFIGLFNFGNRKKLQGAKFGEYSVVIGHKNYKQAVTCEMAIANNCKAHQNMPNLFYLSKTN